VEGGDSDKGCLQLTKQRALERLWVPDLAVTSLAMLRSLRPPRSEEARKTRARKTVSDRGRETTESIVMRANCLQKGIATPPAAPAVFL